MSTKKGGGSYVTCKHMNIWCVHEVHMSSALNGSHIWDCHICLHVCIPEWGSLGMRLLLSTFTFSSNTSVKKGVPRRKVDIVSSCIFETARHHMESTWLTFRKSIRKFLTSYVVPCVASMLWYFSGHFEHEDIDFHTWIITLKTASF